MLVTLGRIEENQRHMTENLNRSEQASVGFQQTAQATFSEQAEKLTQLDGKFTGLDGRLKVIEESMRATFTRSTVIVGLVFTGVNVGFGIFGK